MEFQLLLEFSKNSIKILVKKKKIAYFEWFYFFFHGNSI